MQHLGLEVLIRTCGCPSGIMKCPEYGCFLINWVLISVTPLRQFYMASYNNFAESRRPNMIVKLEQEKPRLYLPAVNNGPVICQPLDINDPPEVRRKKQEREAAKKRKYRPNLTGRHSNPNYHDY